MFSGIDFLLQRTMSSFFIAIKNLLTAYHIDKQSTGKNYRAKNICQCLNLNSIALLYFFSFSSYNFLPIIYSVYNKAD